MLATMSFLLRRLVFPIGIVLVAFSVNSSASQQIITDAAVPSVGVMHDIADAREKPDPSLHYKLVFNVKEMAENLDEVSPGLEAIGGIINTFRKYGVAENHLQVVAVFHGPTIVLLARDATYSHRTGAAKNPNLALLGQLASAGVQLTVCGQSARSQHYTIDDLVASAQMNLSATVTFINLQTRGFVKIDL